MSKGQVNDHGKLLWNQIDGNLYNVGVAREQTIGWNCMELLSLVRKYFYCQFFFFLSQNWMHVYSKKMATYPEG